MRRFALAAGAVVIALVLQLTLVDRLALPGGGAPDLVLLAVVALGLTGGPVAGMLTGFWAGLAMDVAPPAAGMLGEHALVFCVVGYGCGRLSRMTDRSAASALGVAAFAAAAGEVLYVAVGLMLGDPGISWTAIRSVLPPSVLQDVLISPFVVFGIWKAGGQPASRSPGAWLTATRPPARTAGGGLGRLAAGAGLGRLVGSAGVPARQGPHGRPSLLAPPPGFRRDQKAAAVGSVRFGKSAARQGDGWLGSGPRSPQSARTQARRPLRLRPGAGQAGSAVMVQPHRQRPARPVSIRMGQRRRRDGVIGTMSPAAPAGRRYPLSAAAGPARRPRFRSAGRSAGGLAGGLASALISRPGAGGAGLGRTRSGGARFGGTWRGRGRPGTAGPGGSRLGSNGLHGAGLGAAGLGGTGLGGTGLRGAGLRGALLGARPRRGAVARSLCLRLHGRRRGDAVVGGGSLRAPGGLGPASSRPCSRPRFFRRGGLVRRRPGSARSRPGLAPRQPRFARRTLGFPRRQPRVRVGRPSFLASRAGRKLTGRKLTGRSALSRIGRGGAGGVR